MSVTTSLTTDEFLTTNKAKAELKAFTNHCGGNNKGLYEVLTHAAFQYEHKGALALYVRWNKERTKIIELKSIDPKGVRVSEPNDKGEVTHYIVSVEASATGLILYSTMSLAR